MNLRFHDVLGRAGVVLAIRRQRRVGRTGPGGRAHEQSARRLHFVAGAPHVLQRVFVDLHVRADAIRVQNFDFVSKMTRESK